MRRSRLLGFIPLAAALLALPPGQAFADATIPYGEAIVPRESVERRIAEIQESAVSADLKGVVDWLRSLPSPDSRRQAMVETNSGSLSPAFELQGLNADRIQVYIHMDALTEESLGMLASAGVEIEETSPSRPIVQAWIYLDDVERVAELPGVRLVSRPAYANATAGRVQTEGYALMGTPLISFLQNETEPLGTIDGESVMIGVISNGLFGATGQVDKCLQGGVHFANQSLPPRLQRDAPLGRLFATCANVPAGGWFGDIAIFPAIVGSHRAPSSAAYPEGLAMIEVLHDLAPGAMMMYGTARTSVELERVRQFLIPDYEVGTGANVNPFGIDVMVDNLFFVGEGRYDGSSQMSRNATTISRLHNIAYFVTAGGNTPVEIATGVQPDPFPLQITSFFNGDPRDTRAKVHSWSDGVASQRDEALNVDSGPSAGLIDVTLVWDDIWDDANPRATIDLDMYLVPRDTLSLNQAVAQSTRLQNGKGYNPVERLTYLAQPGQRLALVIVNKNNLSNARPLFTLVMQSGRVNETQYLTHAVPLNNSDAVRPVMTVGHIDLTLKRGISAVANDVMPGMTPGHTPARHFLKWYETQEYPTTLGFSGVSTFTTGSPQTGNGFVGPSAGVAHVAGFAALLRHRFPQMPPTRMIELFTEIQPAGEGGDLFPTVLDITPEETKAFHNHPTYRRSNHLALFRLLDDGLIDAYPPIATAAAGQQVLTTESPTGWTSEWSPSGDQVQPGVDRPEFRISDLGLELRPTSALSYGYWESPLLKLQGPQDEEPRSELSVDRLYVVEARVGSTNPDPTTVPDFRLRLTSTQGDESALLVIANAGDDVENAPTTIGGKTYRLYYRPSNDEVAKQGLKFYFEVLNFDPNDDVDTTLILRDFTLKELPVPELDEEQAP